MKAPARVCIAAYAFLVAVSPTQAQNTTRGGTWKILAPTMRTGASMIYDPLRHRMILFGGFDNQIDQNDVWELSLSGPPVWRELHPLGPTPAPSRGHSAIYDPVRDRMIVFGGYYERLACGTCGLEVVQNQGTWALSLSDPPTWTPLDPTGVPAAYIWRRFHTAIYDPLGDRMIVYGGDRLGVTLDDLWSLSLQTMAWTQLTPSPTPGGRANHAAVLDPVRNRMLVFGCSAACGSQGEVWSLSLLGTPAWTKLVPTGAAAVKNVDGGAAVYEPVHDRVVFRTVGQAQVWSLSLSGALAWRLWDPPGEAPAPGGAAVYDIGRGRMVFFGPDLSALSISSDPAWEDFYPPRRDGPSLIYDAQRCRMVMFGGYNGRPLDDVWTLSLGREPVWTRLRPPPGPLPRYLATAVYDPLRERMILYGGLGLYDAWALSLRGDPAWSLIQPQGLAPNEATMVGAYVPTRDELWLFGDFPDDVWSFNLDGAPSWKRVQTAGTAPAPGSAFYQSARDRIVTCGDGVYALSFGAIPGWTTLTPSGIDWSRGVFDPARDRYLTYHDPMRELDLAASSWTQVSSDGPPLTSLSYPSIVDTQNDRAVFYGSQDNSLRSLTWAPAESSVVAAEVWDDSVRVVDGSYLDPNPRLVARIPSVSCLELTSCAVQLDGVALDPVGLHDPPDAITLPALSSGPHLIALRLVAEGARRVVGAAKMTITVAPTWPERVSVEEVRATPNPAHAVVHLRFRLSKPADYAIDLYDMAGRRLGRLAQGRGVFGPNDCVWDGRVDGHLMSSGYYIYQVTARDGSAIVTAHGRALFLR
jgi:galactose oxidase-like protein